jgi:hypothetical protein
MSEVKHRKEHKASSKRASVNNPELAVTISSHSDPRSRAT